MSIEKEETNQNVSIRELFFIFINPGESDFFSTTNMICNNINSHCTYIFYIYFNSLYLKKLGQRKRRGERRARRREGKNKRNHNSNRIQIWKILNEKNHPFWSQKQEETQPNCNSKSKKKKKKKKKFKIQNHTTSYYKPLPRKISSRLTAISDSAETTPRSASKAITQIIRLSAPLPLPLSYFFHFEPSGGSCSSDANWEINESAKQRVCGTPAARAPWTGALAARQHSLCATTREHSRVGKRIAIVLICWFLVDFLLNVKWMWWVVSVGRLVRDEPCCICIVLSFSCVLSFFSLVSRATSKYYWLSVMFQLQFVPFSVVDKKKKWPLRCRVLCLLALAPSNLVFATIFCVFSRCSFVARKWSFSTLLFVSLLYIITVCSIMCCWDRPTRRTMEEFIMENW